MTRDIFEVNNFIVLIEHSDAKKVKVEKCELMEQAIGFAFYGSGEVELDILCGKNKSTFNNTSGMAISFSGNNMEFFHTISPKTPLQSITVFSTLKNLKKLPQESEIFSQHLEPLVNPQSDFVEGPSLFMTPDMNNALNKIFNSSYEGATRLMFLKSQVTELLTHFIANIAEKNAEQIKGHDKEKLYHAKQILDANIAKPPSLNELSKLIGLNDYKLKKNFKELFGIPVFKHLQNERLNKAQELLRESEIGIQEAAWTVGYESVSSFSNAFIKKFGFRPSEIKN